MRVPTPDQTVRCSKHVQRRYLVAALAAAVSLVYSACADTATFVFDILREDLAVALNQIAQQSHIEISYSAELTRGKISPLLKGTYTPEQALKMLLKGSGLQLRRITGGALVIEKGRGGMSSSGGATSDSDARMQMGEIIVTASKRAQDLREVADVTIRGVGTTTPSPDQGPLVCGSAGICSRDAECHLIDSLTGLRSCPLTQPESQP